MEHSAAPIREPSGALRGCVLVFRDVSDRLKAESHLRASEIRFRHMADAAPVMIWISGIDQGRHWFNRQWLNFVGRSLEEETGWGWVENLHADDRERCLQIYQSSFESRESYLMEYRMLRHDGVWRWLLSQGVPYYDSEGEFQGYIGTCIDITDRKQAEAAQRQVFSLAESSDEFIGMFDMDMRPLYVNQAGLEMLGLDDPAALENQEFPRMPELFFPEDRDYMLREFFPRVLREGHAEVEVRFRHFRTGQPIWVIYSVVMLIDENGSPSGFGTVSRDITERRKTEQALRQADRRKDEFLATLAHELRNPLAPIRNSLEVMKRAEDDRAVLRQSRETIERQLAHMVRLVDDLLDVSRITRDKIELRKTRVELHSVLQQALETVRPLIESDAHTVDWELPAEPTWLNADAVRLAQVFSNLFNNACKFMDSGGRISVRARLQDNEVLISVKDTGTGIEPDKLDEIFEMFAQVDSTLERSPTGLGIGLTLVKRLVELHGGRIEARSEGIGRGSEFLVYLPIVAPPENDRLVKNPSCQESPHLLRILVVDDNNDSAETLAMLLRLQGHETRLAYDGLEAVAMAESFRPDLILLDIGLPNLNGLEACRRIRAQAWGRSMVIVALTGWGQREDKLKSQDAGFDEHLVKPVDYDSLSRLLAALPLRQEQ